VFVLQQIIDGASSSGPLVLVSLALTVTLGYLRALNVAFGTFLTISAFVAVRITEHTHAAVLVLLGCMATGAVLTVLVELLLLRPMRRRTEDIELGSFIATFAVSLAGVAAVQSATGSEVISFPQHFPELDKVVSVGSLNLHLFNLVSLVVALALGIGMMVALRDSGTGKALRALAADWEGGQLVGIRVSRIALIVAVGCGALAGLAGFMTAVQSRGTNFLAGESYLLLAFAVVVVGGVGSVGGTLVVGVGVSALTAFLSSEVSSQFTQAMVFALLFIVLIVRPEGFGRIGPTRRRLSRGGASAAVAGEGR
jgi:branched-chain amino acid transport system permease protein